MKKVIFKNEEGESLFISNESEIGNLPRKGENVVIGHLFITVEQVTHNYDSKEIEIEVSIS